jgi:hypothetical protein
MSSVPDVRDGGGRMKRIIIAVVVSVGCAVAAYFIAGQIVAGDTSRASHVSARQLDGGQFQLWVTGATFAVAMILSIGILESLAKKKYLASLKTD